MSAFNIKKKKLKNETLPFMDFVSLMGEGKARIVKRICQDEMLQFFSFLFLVIIRDPEMGNLQSRCGAFTL